MHDDEDPFSVAAEYDLDAAGVFTGLAYYYNNTEELRTLEAEQEERRQETSRSSRAL